MNDDLIWNTLHDGVIEAITGDIPGEVRLSVQIYWCEIWDEPVEAIIVHLKNCTHLEWQSWDGQSILNDSAAIAKLELEILSGSIENDTVKIIGATYENIGGAGFLILKYENLAVFLDNGQLITAVDFVRIWELKNEAE